MIQKWALKATTVALSGLLCFGAVAPASVMAADKPAAAMKAAKAAPNKSIMALQTALNEKGASLKVDGKMGAQTRAALKNFQKANGLKITGRLDKATRGKLGV